VPASPEVGCTQTHYLLIADDEMGVLEVARAMALAIGRQPLIANTAEHALALFRDHADAIEQVLIDYHMPGRNGPELARQMRALRPDVEIHLMTGDATHAAAIAVGDVADGILIKPFVLDELERALEPHSRAA
jgi:CheY-like chemotaxis protein